MIKEMWEDAGFDAYVAKMSDGMDFPEDEGGPIRYRWYWNSRTANFVRRLASRTVCWVRGHRMSFEEGGDAESGPQFSWGCDRCHGVGGWGTMYSRDGDDASKFRWQKDKEVKGYKVW